VQGGGEFPAKLVELARVDIADGPEIETFFRPMPDVKSMPGFAGYSRMLGAQMLRHEQIDHVVVAAIDDCRHGLAVDVVETAADQRKALRREVDDRWREVELAVEPRLDGVLIAGLDIGKMVGLERAQVCGNDFARNLLIRIVAKDGDDKACRHGRRKCRADSEAAEESAPRHSPGIAPGIAHTGHARRRCKHRGFDAVI
jgi:hypothetical protein